MEHEDTTAAGTPPVDRPVRRGWWPHFWDGMGLGPLWRWMRDGCQSKAEAKLLRDMDHMILVVGQISDERERALLALHDLRWAYHADPSCQKGMVPRCLCIRCAETRATEALNA